ncbi:hypothetical protein C8Q77DRAFT_423463 [Trametes polyzona]|nr:hypothetical protein C8Q77DRAFT_423463 [Trametes polyzona]
MPDYTCIVLYDPEDPPHPHSISMIHTCSCPIVAYYILMLILHFHAYVIPIIAGLWVSPCGHHRGSQVEEGPTIFCPTAVVPLVPVLIDPDLHHLHPAACENPTPPLPEPSPQMSTLSTQSTYRVRPFLPGDEPRLSLICCQTGANGGDSTSHLLDDSVLGEIFVLPYAHRHPDLTFVVVAQSAQSESAEAEAEVVVGYACATDDSDAFYTWYGEEWWPSPMHGGRFHRPTAEELERAEGAERERLVRQREMLSFEDTKGPKPTPPEFDLTEQYPAHLHINLLPECRGRGLGRELIERLCEALRRKGSRGVHLAAGDNNDDAAIFYTKIGFAEVPAEEGLRCFVKKL